jgi:hypothetical protein
MTVQNAGQNQEHIMYDVTQEPVRPDDINETTHSLLRVWSRGEKADIMPDVDSQIALLGQHASGSYPVNGATKQYMSEWMAHKANRLFTIGSQWALFADGQDLILREDDGKMVTVTETGRRGPEGGYYGHIRVQTVEQNENGIPGWYVRAAHLRPLDRVTVAEPEITLEEAKANIKLLEADVALYKEREERATKRANLLYFDFEKTNRLLNQFADEKDYCSEYEDYLEKINAEIGGYVFEGREEEYEVTVTVPVRADVAVSVTISAPKNTDHSDIEEQAIEQASQMYDTTDLVREVDTYCAEGDWDDARAEVQ